MTTVDLDTRQHDLPHAVETAAAIDAARRLGVLDLLDAAPADVAEVARRSGTNLELTDLLLDALHALGVLGHDDQGRYEMTPEGRWCATLAGGWSRLEEPIRTGRPTVSVDTSAGAGVLYPDVVAMLSRLVAPAAETAARLLTPVGGAVLDVGAGAAPWSIALARINDICRVTALDVPEVLATTRRTVAEAGIGDRFDFLAGDMLTIELPPAGYDLV